MGDYCCGRCGYKIHQEDFFVVDGCLTGYHCPHCGNEVDWDTEVCDDPLEGDI